MLAKGHHFPHVTLVAILDIDSGLFSLIFARQKKMGQLRAGSRTCRARRKSGECDDTKPLRTTPSVASIAERSYQHLARLLLAERQLLAAALYLFGIIVCRTHAPTVRTTTTTGRGCCNLQTPVPGRTTAGPFTVAMEKRVNFIVLMCR